MNQIFTKIKTIIAVLIGVLAFSEGMFGQCANNGTYYADLTPVGVGPANAAYTTCAWGGEYYTVSVTNGYSYNFNTCGTTYDTQLTLRNNSTGALLGYDDDGSACGAGASDLNWTATFTGVVRVQINYFNCITLQECMPLEAVLTSAGSCGEGYIGLTQAQCEDGAPSFDVTFTGGGDCGFSTLFISEDGGAYVQLPVAAFNSDAINIYGTLSYSTYSVYAQLSDGSFTNTQTITLTDCGGASSQPVYFVITPDCYGSEVGWILTDTQGTPLYVADYGSIPSGASTEVSYVTTLYLNPGCYNFEIYDSYGDGLNPVGTSCTLVGSYGIVDEGLNILVMGDANYGDGTTDPFCIGGPTCSVTSSTATFVECVDGLATMEMNVQFTNGCQIASLWVNEGEGYYELAFPFTVQSGVPYDFTGLLPSNMVSYYYEFSTGALSTTYSFNTPACGPTCSVTSSTATFVECVDGLATMEMNVQFTNGCQIASLWVNEGEGYYELAFPFTVQSGVPYDFTGLLPSNTVSYYYEFSTGALSTTYSFNTPACGPTCSVTSSTATFVECVDGLATMEMNVQFTNGCQIASLWVNEGEGYYELPFTFTVQSGVPYDFIGLLPSNTVSYYYEFSTGALSTTYSFNTPACNVPCGNAILSFTEGDCIPVGSTTYASVNFNFSFTGTCAVQTFYYSTDGGNTFSPLDVSAEGYVNGSSDLYYLTPGVTYQIYYVLPGGAASNIVTLETDDCGLGGTICDCAGTELPVAATAWLGDGSLDDGTYLWNGVTPVDFNCAVWGFDCGDDGNGVILDMFGTCSGDLPPGNGCVEIPCENYVEVQVAIDCFPGETSLEILNEEGEIVYAFDQNFFSEPYSMVTQGICLTSGCYTFSIFDSEGDGLSYPTCDFDGFFTVIDENGEVLVSGDPGFGFVYTQEFCVGGESCSNLALSASQAPCYDNGEGVLLPSVELSIDYDGTCDVAVVYIQSDGEYYEFPQEGVTAGSVLAFFNFQPNTTYQFFYLLSDGSVSNVVSYTTGNCNNEITICDCAGTSHTIGVLSWLGDGFADVGAYEWAGEPVNFNCATWGYDCGDIEGAPSLDVYGVCSGNLPPNNGCTQEVLGCTDPQALNYNPDATVNNGSCVYSSQFGCMDPGACNYNPTAQFDNGGCEYLTCAGCTDPEASNYNPNATIDNGTCIYETIPGCTDPSAINYNPTATEDDGSCIDFCEIPTVTFAEHCVDGENDTYMVTLEISALGNAAPYIVTNTYNQQQFTVNFNGTIEIGPFPNNESVVVTMVSTVSNQCVVISPLLNHDCPEEVNVNELTLSMMSLYPNPTNGVVTLVNGGGIDRMNIRVLSQTGQVVENKQMIIPSGSSAMLDLSGLAAGTYHVEIMTSEKVEHHQLIIQK